MHKTIAAKQVTSRKVHLPEFQKVPAFISFCLNHYEDDL